MKSTNSALLEFEKLYLITESGNVCLIMCVFIHLYFCDVITYHGRIRNWNYRKENNLFKKMNKCAFQNGDLNTRSYYILNNTESLSTFYLFLSVKFEIWRKSVKLLFYK